MHLCTYLRLQPINKQYGVHLLNYKCTVSALSMHLNKGVNKMRIKKLVIPMSSYEEIEKRDKIRFGYLDNWDKLLLSKDNMLLIFLKDKFRKNSVNFAFSNDGDLLINACQKKSESTYYFQIPEEEIVEVNPWCVISIINFRSSLNYGHKFFNEIIHDWETCDVLKSIKADVEAIKN